MSLKHQSQYRVSDMLLIVEDLRKKCSISVFRSLNSKYNGSHKPQLNKDLVELAEQALVTAIDYTPRHFFPSCPNTVILK
jgi:hypothetical protein